MSRQNCDRYQVSIVEKMRRVELEKVSEMAEKALSKPVVLGHFQGQKGVRIQPDTGIRDRGIVMILQKPEKYA